MTELGFHKDGSFRFHIPATLEKSEDGKTWISGIASVETPDLVGETVILNGMDLSYLLSRGFFNDNHAKETDGKVGIPTDARVTRDGLFVKGYLLDTPRAQGIRELAAALQKSGSDRRLGFSIEGKTLERDGKMVKRSWIKDIAITAEPTHPSTFLDVVKSISARIKENGYIEESGAVVKIGASGEPQTFWQKIGDVVSKSVRDQLDELRGQLPVFEKSIEAGHQNPPVTGGSALRNESLEADLKNQDLPGKEGFDKDQALKILRDRGYSDEAAQKMVEMLFDSNVRAFLAATKL